MQLNIYNDYETLSLRVSDLILETVSANPTCILCLATGDTPRFAYQLMTARAIRENIDFTRCTFIGLDEWAGISPDSEGSCHYFLTNLIFKPLNISPEQVFLFDGMSADPHEECRKIDRVLDAVGKIDLLIVGVGLNGHIGFNEPGISADFAAHVVELDETTRLVGQKYFTQATELKQGITLGFKQILNSKKLIMMANGVKKAPILKKAVEEPIEKSMPASIVRTMSNSVAMIDREAAGLLSISQLSDDIILNSVQ